MDHKEHTAAKKPVVLITGPDKGGKAAWLCSVFQVKIAGGVSVRAQPSTFKKHQHFDALVLTGGSDLHPSLAPTDSEAGKKRSKWEKFLDYVRYPESFFFLKGNSNKGYDKPRDAMEMDILDKAIEEGKPVLAICRGMQLVNAKFGGRFYSSIPSLYHHHRFPISLFPCKEITIDPSSKLAGIMPSLDLKVNALHHQAVKSLGDGLAEVALEEIGLVQSIEWKSKHTSSYIIGVQWHPEYLFYLKPHRALFKWLVKSSQISSLPYSRKADNS